MKKMARNIALIGLLLSLSLTAGAQGHIQKAMQRAQAQREAMSRAQAIREQSDAPQLGEYLRMA